MLYYEHSLSLGFGSYHNNITLNASTSHYTCGYKISCFSLQKKKLRENHFNDLNEIMEGVGIYTCTPMHVMFSLGLEP